MKLIDLLSEGPYDPYNYKAIMMAGSPGSGKSFVTKKISETFGLRKIDLDFFIEMLSMKQKIDLTQNVNYEKFPEMRDKARILKNKMRDLAFRYESWAYY